MLRSKKVSILYILSVATALAYLGLAIYLFINSPGNTSIIKDFSGVDTIDKNVEIVYQDGSSDIRDLPAILEKEGFYSVVYDISKVQDIYAKSIDIGLVYSSFRCFADGHIIYEYNANDNNAFKSGAYSVHTIDIPRDLKKKEIMIEFVPMLKNKVSSTVRPLIVGNKINIFLYHLLNEEIILIYFAMLLIGVFAGSFFIYLFTLVEGKVFDDILNIGFLSLFIALYYISRTWVLRYMLSQHHNIIYFLEFSSLVLFMVPFMNILKGKLNPKLDKYIELGIAFIFIVLLGQYGLYVFKGIEFRELIMFSHIVLLINILIATAVFLFSKKETYPNKVPLLVAFAPMLVGIFLQVILYVTYKAVVYVEFILIAVFAFVVIETYNIINSFIELQNENMKNSIYKELAFVDQVTGLGNRTAYSNMIKKIEKNKSSLWIISMDLNNLKNINDNYGHQKGDEMIKLFSNALLKSTEKYEKAYCYRIGGDEFILLLFKSSEFEATKVIADMKNNLKDVPEPFASIEKIFAYGITYHNSRVTKNIDESIHSADKKMYVYKKLSKKTFVRSGRRVI